jgi:hypothetical protein
MNPLDARLFPTCVSCGRPAPIGKRKCGRCLNTKRFKVIQGNDCRRGANATGIAAHKPDKSHTKRAKRQNPPYSGPRPLQAYHWRTI